MDLRQRAAIAAGIVVFGCGCGAITGAYPSGSLYNSTTVPHGVDKLEMAGASKSTSKTGEACATGILGLIAFGDASVEAAKKAGSVTDINSVEIKSFSILNSVYATACTVVNGK